MKKLNIEHSIRNSIYLDTPDLFDKIVSTPVRKMESEDYIVKSRPKSVVSKLRPVFALCSSFAILFAICFGFINNYNTVDSIISIDVNPSIKITTNKSDKVLSVKAYNTDGKIVLDNAQLEKKDIDTTVNSIMTSMVDQGYIDEDKNSILVYVSNRDQVKATKVTSTVVTDISSTLSQKEIKATVYNKSITDTADLEELAAEYDISFGKMKFIADLVEKDPSLSINELAALSLQELSNLVNDKNIDLKDVVDTNNNEIEVAAQTEKRQATTQSNEDNKPAATTKDEAGTTDALPEDVEPKTEATTATDSSISEPSNQPTGGNSHTTSNATTTTAATIVNPPDAGTAVAKTACSLCSASCSCSNCSDADGCKSGCRKCDKTCSNYKPNNDSSQTTTTEPDNNEDEEIVNPSDNKPSDSNTSPGTTTEDGSNSTQSTEMTPLPDDDMTTTEDTLDSNIFLIE